MKHGGKTFEKFFPFIFFPPVCPYTDLQPSGEDNTTLSSATRYHCAMGNPSHPQTARASLCPGKLETRSWSSQRLQKLEKRFQLGSGEEKK